MSVTFHFVEQGSEQWHADRESNGGVYTGSNAHKLLSTMDVREYAKAKQSDFKGNFWTKRGHILEDEALALYEQIYDVNIMRNDEGIKVGYITNTKFPGCLYSPDAVVPDIIDEVKCFDAPAHQKLLDGNIDLKILAQIHYGLTISEFNLAHLIAYCPQRDELTGKPIFPVRDQFKVIPIKANRNIKNNFRRILTQEKAVA